MIVTKLQAIWFVFMGFLFIYSLPLTLNESTEKNKNKNLDSLSMFFF